MNMDRADIIKKNRNEWFDKACEYKAENKKLQAELKAKDERIEKLESSFMIFIKGVQNNANNMSYEKMNPTLTVHFNHLLGSIKFALQALKQNDSSDHKKSDIPG